jgi:hypothetical protein
MPRDFNKHKLDKTVDEEGKGKYNAQQRNKCALRIRSELQQGTFVNSALLHYTNGLILRNTSRLQNTKTLHMQRLQYWVQKYHLYSQTIRI